MRSDWRPSPWPAKIKKRDGARRGKGERRGGEKNEGERGGSRMVNEQTETSHYEFSVGEKRIRESWRKRDRHTSDELKARSNELLFALHD
jgi:hypothetical protein